MAIAHLIRCPMDSLPITPFLLTSPASLANARPRALVLNERLGPHDMGGGGGEGAQTHGVTE